MSPGLPFVTAVSALVLGGAVSGSVLVTRLCVLPTWRGLRGCAFSPPDVSPPLPPGLCEHRSLRVEWGGAGGVGLRLCFL